jgi:hypothetical protein
VPFSPHGGWSKRTMRPSKSGELVLQGVGSRTQRGTLIGSGARLCGLPRTPFGRSSQKPPTSKISNVCLCPRSSSGFPEVVCTFSTGATHLGDPPPPMRELVAATVGRRKANGAVVCALPRSPDHESKLSHKLVNVVVVAVLDAGADASGPHGPQAVADPALAEGCHARGGPVRRIA